MEKSTRRQTMTMNPKCHKGSPFVIGVKSKRLAWTKHDNFEGKCPSQAKEGHVKA